MMIKAIRIILLASSIISISALTLQAEEISETGAVIEKKETLEMVEASVEPSTAEAGPSVALQLNSGGDMESYEAPYDPPSANFQMAMLKAIGGLGIVLCLMAALYYTGRKYFPKYFTKSDSGKSLKLIETLSMGDKRSISIIQVENRRFLIANTSNQINLLSSIESEMAVSSRSGNEPITSDPAAERKEIDTPFKNLFEIEKRRPLKKAENPLPEDVRMKMRMLREALER